MAQNIQIAITSDEMWDSEIRKTTGFLQVIDVHQAWCGPCKAIQATFRRIFFDNNDRPLKFYTAESDKLAALEPYRGKCEPLFLIYTNGEKIAKIEGVNAPALTQAIMKNLHARDE